jgi:hypothetical protein
MSDLQCPARLVVAWPRSSPEPSQALDLVPELVRVLAGERVALVYGVHSVLADPVSTGLGVPLAPVPDLETVADLHRGETVLVLASGAAVLDPVRGRLVHGHAGEALDGWAPGDQAPDWVIVRVDVDADGWLVRHTADDAPLR